MSQDPLDELYFNWLCDEVGLDNHTRLLLHLYKREMEWFIPNDDNRIKDGQDIRQDFIYAQKIKDVDEDWLALGCSMLELILGLSRRLSFMTEGEPRDWFWHLLCNTGLQRYNDRHYSQTRVSHILDSIISRTYDYDGRGGFFPLLDPDSHEDQRTVELWYQLNAYVMERY